MNFKHSKNLHPSSENISKIQSIAWSPNNMRIAVAQSDFLRKKLELLWILIRIKIREKEKTHK